MSIDLDSAKQNLLNLKEEYETRIDKIEGLPTLFTTMTIFLVVTAVILLLLAKPINNMLKNSEQADKVS